MKSRGSRAGMTQARAGEKAVKAYVLFMGENDAREGPWLHHSHHHPREEVEIFH